MEVETERYVKKNPNAHHNPADVQLWSFQVKLIFANARRTFLGHLFYDFLTKRSLPLYAHTKVWLTLLDFLHCYIYLSNASPIGIVYKKKPNQYQL